MSTLIIIKKIDKTLIDVTRELVKEGETLNFLSKVLEEDVSSLRKFGSVYNLCVDSMETSIDYDGWVDLILDSNRIIVWG